MIKSFKYPISILLLLFISCKSKKGLVLEPETQTTIMSPGKLKMESPEKSMRMFIDANKEKVIGNLQNAEDLFKKSISLDPKNAAAYFELSKLSIEKVALYPAQVNKLLGQAIEYGEKAHNIDPDNTWYLENQAYLYESSSNLDKATDVYTRLIDLKPKNIGYLQSLSAIYQSKGEYKKAIAVYNQIEKKTSRSKITTFKKAQLYMQLEDDVSAENEIKALIEKEPNEIDYYQKLAEIQIKQKKDQAVFQTFEKMKQLDPKNGLTRLSLSRYYYSKKQYNKAHIEMCAAFNDKFLPIDKKVFTLLSLYEETEKDSSTITSNQVEELIDTLIKIHPNDAKAYTVAGDYYLQKQNKLKAVTAFRKAREIDPSRYVIWNQISLLEAELEAYDSLAISAEKSIELFPNQPIPFYFGGVAYNQLKEHQKAVDMLENGLTLVIDPNLKLQFYTLLGDSYNSLKNYTDSDAYFERALEIDPQNAVVLNNYAYYLSERNESLEKAKAMSKKSLEIEPKSSTFADTYAWILFKNKEYKKAKEWIEKAIASGGSESGVIVEHYGDILFHLQDVSGAEKQWKKAKETGGASDFIDKKISDKYYYE